MTWTPPYQINYASDGDTVYGAVVKCDNNIADAYSKLTILDTYRTEDHADISQLELAFDSLDSYVDDIASDVATLQQDLDTLEGSVSTLSSTVSGHTTSIGTLQSDLGTLSSTVSGHTTTLSSHTTSISTLNSTVSSHTTSISSLTSGKVDIGTANTITANHVFSGNPTVSGTLQFTGSGYIMSPSYYVGNGTTKHLIKWDSSDDTLVFSYNGSWQQSWPYAYNGTCYLNPNTTYFAWDHRTDGKLYCHNIYYGHTYTDGLSLDTTKAEYERWTLHTSICKALTTHNVDDLPEVLKHRTTEHQKSEALAYPTSKNVEAVEKTYYESANLLQIALECIDDLRTEVAELKLEIDALRGKGATPRVSVIPPRTLVVDI